MFVAFHQEAAADVHRVNRCAQFHQVLIKARTFAQAALNVANIGNLCRTGISIKARLEAKRVERIRNTSSGADKTAKRDTEICHVLLRYVDPGTGQAIRKQLQLTYMTICERYSTGQNISAKLITSNPALLILEEDRISWYWRWISLALFGFLASFVVLIVRASLRTRRPR